MKFYYYFLEKIFLADLHCSTYRSCGEQLPGYCGSLTASVLAHPCLRDPFETASVEVKIIIYVYKTQALASLAASVLAHPCLRDPFETASVEVKIIIYV